MDVNEECRITSGCSGPTWASRNLRSHIARLPARATEPQRWFYNLHVLRVMRSLETVEERIAGVLHDIVEDTDWSLEALSGRALPTTLCVRSNSLGAGFQARALTGACTCRSGLSRPVQTHFPRQPGSQLDTA